MVGNSSPSDNGVEFVRSSRLGPDVLTKDSGVWSGGSVDLVGNQDLPVWSMVWFPHSDMGARVVNQT